MSASALHSAYLCHPEESLVPPPWSHLGPSPAPSTVSQHCTLSHVVSPSDTRTRCLKSGPSSCPPDHGQISQVLCPIDDHLIFPLLFPFEQLEIRRWANQHSPSASGPCLSLPPLDSPLVTAGSVKVPHHVPCQLGFSFSGRHCKQHKRTRIKQL